MNYGMFMAFFCINYAESVKNRADVLFYSNKFCIFAAVVCIIANIKRFARVNLTSLLFVLTGLTCQAQTADTVRHDPFPATLALKTNMLYDVALVPNVGAELYIGGRWTIGADLFFTWLSKESRDWFWQGYGGYFTIRRYFGPPLNSKHSTFTSQLLSGHHLGIYALGLTYDVAFGGRGYQADKFGFGGGVEYGYSWPVSRKLCLDFSIGVGFQDGEYKTYDPQDGHYVWQSTSKRHWFGPTKAEISLKWLLGEKGGRR